MKSLIVIIFYFSFNVYSQDCAVSLSQDQIEYFAASNSERRNYSQSRSGIIWFPVQHHIIQQNSGESFLVEQLPEIMNDLNSQFIDAGIQFYEYSSVNIIYDPENYSFSIADQSVCDLFDIEGVINVYYVNSISDPSNGSFYSGYAYYPGNQNVDRIFMQNICALNGVTINHEFGHYFSLYHTHGSNATEDELVDGSNCAFAGDEICDTSADPNLNDYDMFDDCEYIGGVVDVNGEFYSPPLENFMSYAPRLCKREFSPEQLDRVAYSAEFDRAYLNTSFTLINGCTDMSAINYDVDAMVDDGSCEYSSLESDCNQGFSIKLYQGWNNIGYTCPNSMDVFLAFEDLVDILLIAKDNAGNAYLPEYNFSGLGDLESGYGYQIKLEEEVLNFNICE